MPDYLVLEHWIGLKKAKQREVNYQSLTIAQVASMVYNYIRDRDKSEPLGAKDFLPFPENNSDLEVSKETAIIFLEAARSNLIPVNILDEFARVNDGELIKQIIKLGKKDESY